MYKVYTDQRDEEQRVRDDKRAEGRAGVVKGAHGSWQSRDRRE
jgi:hypothetical protein